ncbi:MAG TPA: HNH nuclease family protein [Nitrospiraceae bacterium]|nr:HNH nuclease family protein [Nitrospiraceae bacterium]
MASEKRPAGDDKAEQTIAAARRDREEREKAYRDRALKLFPQVCGRCSREFSGKKLRELTVHHKDHNHDNNPPDGSNWELLCIYCHEDAHSRLVNAQPGSAVPAENREPLATHRPFEGLAELLKRKA